MLSVGDTAPDFSAFDIVNGVTFSLSTYANDIVLIAFNGLTWCGPCRFEAPILQELWLEFEGTTSTPLVQFVMVAVACEPEELTQALAQFGISMPVINDRYSIIANNLYEIGGVPTVFVVGPGLRISGIKVGASGSADTLKDEIRQMILGCYAPPIAVLPKDGTVIVASPRVERLLNEYHLREPIDLLISEILIVLCLGEDRYEIPWGSIHPGLAPRQERGRYVHFVRELLSVLEEQRQLIEQWTARIPSRQHVLKLRLASKIELGLQGGVPPATEASFLIDNIVQSVDTIPPLAFTWNVYSATEGKHDLRVSTNAFSARARVLVLHPQ